MLNAYQEECLSRLRDMGLARCLCHEADELLTRMKDKYEKREEPVCEAWPVVISVKAFNAPTEVTIATNLITLYHTINCLNCVLCPHPCDGECREEEHHEQG